MGRWHWQQWWGEALTDDGLRLSVCLSVCHQSRMCDASTKTTIPINVKIRDNVATTSVDNYRMQYYDVITNPRWLTAANQKSVMSAYPSENDGMKFGTLNQMLMIKIMRLITFHFLKSKIHDGRWASHWKTSVLVIARQRICSTFANFMQTPHPKDGRIRM